MYTLEGYRSTYTELRRTIEELRALLAEEQWRSRPNTRRAYEALCDLGDRVRRHLADEDRGLYPTLLIHDDPAVNSIAWGLLSDEKPLRQSFEEYYERWLKYGDRDFDEDFLAETREVFDLVAQRIEREERVLIPKLIEIGLFGRERPASGGASSSR